MILRITAATHSTNGSVKSTAGLDNLEWVVAFLLWQPCNTGVVMAKNTNRVNRMTFFYTLPVTLALVIVASILDGTINKGTNGSSLLFTMLAGLASSIYIVLVGIKRLHDINQSGWWMLTAWVPVLNLILAIELFLKVGDAEPNKYGNPPTKSFVYGLTNR